nr:hypothetical protein C1892_07400 [Pseudomonas sp. MPBD7-1]
MFLMGGERKFAYPRGRCSVWAGLIASKLSSHILTCIHMTLWEHTYDLWEPSLLAMRPGQTQKIQ